MDQLKTGLAYAKKYSFWLMCLTIVLVGPLCWYLASADLYKEFQANTSRIQSSKGEMERIRGVSQHPNDDIIEGIKADTQVLRYQVWKLWDTLYNRQRTEVLQWPEGLGEDFINYVDQRSFGEEIAVDLRERYQNYIEEEVEKLPGYIDSEVTSTDEEMIRRRKKGQSASPEHVLQWDGGDYERIKQLLVRPGKKPTSIWVWATQEDLWIYETILSALAAVNKDSLGPHDAVVSVLENMEVGKPAASDAAAFGRLDPQKAAGGPGGTPAVPAAGGSANQATEEAELLDNRYVDESGEPIKAKDATNASEYKRVPMRIKVRMDPGKLHALIVELANASLPVEVQQVRINPQSDTGRQSTSPMSEEDRESDKEAGRKVPHVPVVIQGVIYIFNPPDLQKIGLTQADLTAGPPPATAPASPPLDSAQPKAAPGQRPQPADDTAGSGTPLTTAPAGTTGPAGARDAGAAGEAVSIPAPSGELTGETAQGTPSAVPAGG